MIQNLGKRPFHPDDSDMKRFKPGDKGDDKNGGGGPGNGMLSAFLPNQKAMLARQLNTGFGGGLKHWNGILGQTYAPVQSGADFKYGGGGNGGKKNNNGGDPDQPGKDDTPSNPGFEPHSRAVMPMGMQAQPMVAQQQQQQMNPMANQMLGAQPPMNLDPQTIMMLRQRLGFGVR